MQTAKIAVVIATKARPQILEETLKSIRRQTRPAAHVYVSASSVEDVPSGATARGVVALVGSPGGSAQRNAAIRRTPRNVQYIAFFDDDVELHPSYLENAVGFLEKNPEVVAISGVMLADGRISREEARALLERDRTWMSAPHFRFRGPHHTLYACNAVVRTGPLLETLFDENLPLYSYGEDYDLSLRLKKFGRVGRLSNAVGAHLKAQVSRVSGMRYGYAMVANNWYFIQKGVCHLAPPWSYVRFILVIVLKRLCIDFWNALCWRLHRDPWADSWSSPRCCRHYPPKVLSRPDPGSLVRHGRSWYRPPLYQSRAWCTSTIKFSEVLCVLCVFVMTILCPVLYPSSTRVSRNMEL